MVVVGYEMKSLDFRKADLNHLKILVKFKMLIEQGNSSICLVLMNDDILLWVL